MKQHEQRERERSSGEKLQFGHIYNITMNGACRIWKFEIYLLTVPRKGNEKKTTANTVQHRAINKMHGAEWLFSLLLHSVYFVCTSFRRVFCVCGYSRRCCCFSLQKLRLFYERLKSISEHHNLDTLFFVALALFVLKMAWKRNRRILIHWIRSYALHTYTHLIFPISIVVVLGYSHCECDITQLKLSEIQSKWQHCTIFGMCP